MLEYKKLISRKLHIFINDNMLEFAKKEGFKIPVVSIKQHYNKKGVFVINYKNNEVANYELNIVDEKGKSEAIYLMN